MKISNIRGLLLHVILRPLCGGLQTNLVIDPGDLSGAFLQYLPLV